MKLTPVRVACVTAVIGMAGVNSGAGCGPKVLTDTQHGP